MREKDVDGGQAFPIAAEYITQEGMTLRDWFAGQAMAAIIISNNADVSAHSLGAAKDAYQVADYMIEARK